MSGLGIFIFIVILVLAIGIAGAIKRQQEIQWLEQNGVRIEARVREIQKHQEARQQARQIPDGSNADGSLQMRTEWETIWETYYYVVAEGRQPQTGKGYLFRSERLSSHPWHLAKGSTVTVFFDPNNPGRYVMEVETSMAGPGA